MPAFTRSGGDTTATECDAVHELCAPAPRLKRWPRFGGLIIASMLTGVCATTPSSLSLGIGSLSAGNWAVVSQTADRAMNAFPRPGGTEGLIWSDEFTTLDLTTSTHVGMWRANDFWQNINRGYRDFAGSSWNLNPNETPGHNPFSITGGALKITATPTPAALNSTIAASMAAQGISGSVPSWSGGMLITNQDLVQFRYGYFEIRVKFPEHGPGMFPAIWFYGTGNGGNPASKARAEIDMFEIFGDPNGQQWHTGVHFTNSDGNPVRPSVGIASGSIDTTQWHTYALDWQPTYMRFYIDGQLKGQITGADAAWFDTKMSLRINYATDASWFPASNRTTAGSTPLLSMLIDYIRVYDQKPA